MNPELAIVMEDPDEFSRHRPLFAVFGSSRLITVLHDTAESDNPLGSLAITSLTE